MLNANDARKIAKDATATTIKDQYDRLTRSVERIIRMHSELGDTGAYVTEAMLECDGVPMTHGIEILADELRGAGYMVSIHYNVYRSFDHMYVSW